MIPRTLASWQLKTWQEELADLIQDPKELLEYLELPNQYLKPALEAQKLFPLRLTRSYAQRITKGNIHDPLLKQVLPIADELKIAAGYESDPLKEQEATVCPGIIHKYHNRVLAIGATQCAINCRYCFRRHFPYSDNQMSRSDWLNAFEYLQQNPQVDELILSGGDPLSMSDKQLKWLLDHAQNISSLKRFRIHSRYPIILPSRINQELSDILSQTSLQTVMVVHCNHPQEIDDAVAQAFARLKSSGTTLLNQSVLLRDINNNTDTLAELSLKLFEAGALPYYLHLLDKVQGASHFDLSEEEAKALYKELMAKLPGYLLPKLAKEEPFARSKTLLCP